MICMCPIRFGLLFGFSLGIAFLRPGIASTQSCQQPVAKVVSVQGTVEARGVRDAPWQPVALNDTFCPGDTIQVGARSRSDVVLLNQSVLRLNANTTMTFEALEEERTSLISLVKGVAHFFSRGPRNLEVRTPFTVAGVRGTEFLVRVDDQQTFLSIFEGTVLASNEVGNLMLSRGQSAVAESGKAPTLRVVARPRDAVRWALYYPPVIYVHPDDFRTGDDKQERVRQSAAFYLKGEYQQAFDRLEQVAENIRDPRFFAYRATLLLAVGRVDEANADIARALNLDPNYSDAFALKSILAVVQNNLEKALILARKSIAAAPHAATARIALSYAQQAQFDLQGARSSLQQAVQWEPGNALAWARLAELHASFGHLDPALQAVEKAVALAPNLSRTQTVLGFTYLLQVKIKSARDAFEKAILLDQAAPLARLGLGLAKIREGDVLAGREDIEIATSLDPNNALIRSYLGKAYFEDKRTALAERQFEVAKELDPKDPTPWLYDAIQKQTTNQPVGALHDLQRAIDLNDNRAVYRSRLLLDSDLAARSASLARIYSDLGFQQRALVEGWQAVNTDPSNFSAHRFLADSYSALPRHNIARVSELLQSQLLQPLNLTPIQPRLAESNLFLSSAGGPESLSFNEFNPLFNRDRMTLLASGLVAENDTLSGEMVVSGIYKKVSFSFGYSHFETSGFRPSNDQNDDIANAFLQMELTHQTSLQAEFRYRNRTNEDLELRFFPDDFRANHEEKKESYSFRGGLRHAFSPGSILLGSLMYQQTDISIRDEPAVPFINSIVGVGDHQPAVSAELQYLWRWKPLNITTGIGYFDIGDKTTLTIDRPLPFGSSTSTINGDVEHTNLYLYADLSLPLDVTLTLGASGDFFNTKSSTAERTNQFNPKVGVTWKPLPTTTIRAAAFRVLKRTLVTDQTLEPTQVAGFNQFFDDINATDAWRYGVAIDQRFSLNIYGGIELSKRMLTVPFQIRNVTTNTVSRTDWDEYQGRAYLFWTPHTWLALSAEYQYERFKRNEGATNGIKEVTTHRLPLGFKVFHPSGWSVSLKSTYFNQKGDFNRRGTAPDVFESGKDDFWIVDTNFNYRLPKRHGFITVGATNLFDEQFRYQETDLNNPLIQPDRIFFARLTLALP